MLRLRRWMGPSRRNKSGPPRPASKSIKPIHQSRPAARHGRRHRRVVVGGIISDDVFTTSTLGRRYRVLALSDDLVIFSLLLVEDRFKGPWLRKAGRLVWISSLTNPSP